MKDKIIKDKITKDYYIERELDSGFKIILYPKSGFNNKGAYLLINYGSLNNIFLDKNSNMIKHRDGIAHFLEHKLFENTDSNIFKQMNKYGANVNAFTSHNLTCYYFHTTQSFVEPLRVLLNIPFSASYTQKGVEEERSIIANEIAMYKDDPDYKAYINGMKELYKKHPIGIDIAGDEESINLINKKDLDEVLDNFYIASNMSLVVVGDFEDDYLDFIEKELNEKYFEKNNKRKNIFYDDPLTGVDKVIKEEKDCIASFSYIFKFEPVKNSFNNSISKKIQLEILFGSSSSFFKELYMKNLFLNFSYDYSYGEKYSMIVLSGQTDRALELKKELDKKIKNINKEKLNETDITRVKNKSIGRFLFVHNSISSLAMNIISLRQYGVELFDYLSILNNEDIKLDLFNERYDSVFSIVGKE